MENDVGKSKEKWRNYVYTFKKRGVAQPTYGRAHRRIDAALTKPCAPVSAAPINQSIN